MCDFIDRLWNLNQIDCWSFVKNNLKWENLRVENLVSLSCRFLGLESHFPVIIFHVPLLNSIFFFFCLINVISDHCPYKSSLSWIWNCVAI